MTGITKTTKNQLTPFHDELHARKLNIEKRKDKLVQKLKKNERKIDCVLITSLPNLMYYFNYGGASFERFCGGIVSLGEGRSALVIPKLDEGKAALASVDSVFPWTDSEGYGKALAEALKSIGVPKSRVFGCEEWITLHQMELVKKVRATSKFENITETISDQRLVKSEEEIVALRGSTSKLGKGYEKIPEILKEGKSEIEVAFDIRKALGDLGVADVDFCGVQSGPNSSVPHSLTTSKKLSSGDMVVIDISCRDDSGYFADFTRTFSIGKASEEKRAAYEVVKEAQSTGVKTSRPNTPAKKIDFEVRSVIEKAGYGQYFIHRTGHGLGLEVHEAPWITDSNSSKLRAGMVYTVEPGVYLPGEFGIRIEDDVVLTASGNENLTNVTHDLIEV